MICMTTGQVIMWAVIIAAAEFFLLIGIGLGATKVMTIGKNNKTK